MIHLAGDQVISVSFVRNSQGVTTELRCDFNSVSTMTSVSPELDGIAIGYYLVGLALTDILELNLGSRVVIAGNHAIDLVVREIVSSSPGSRIRSVDDDLEFDSVDAVIGCDVKGLLHTLPFLRRGGVIVLSCGSIEDGRLDLYGSLHRNGLTLRSLDVKRDVVAKLPELVMRLENIVTHRRGFETAARQNTNLSDG